MSAGCIATAHWKRPLLRFSSQVVLFSKVAFMFSPTLVFPFPLSFPFPCSPHPFLDRFFPVSLSPLPYFPFIFYIFLSLSFSFLSFHSSPSLLFYFSFLTCFLQSCSFPLLFSHFLSFAFLPSLNFLSFPFACFPLLNSVSIK